MPTPLVRYLLCRVSQRTERRRPGPRRGHTAARAFEGSPVQLASHAISCFRRSEATVDQLTGLIAMLAIAPGSQIKDGHSICAVAD